MHEGLKAFGALAKLGRKTPVSSAPSTPMVQSALRREVVAVMKEAMQVSGLNPRGPQAAMLLTLISTRSETELAEMARLVVEVGKRLQHVLPDESGNEVTG